MNIVNADFSFDELTIEQKNACNAIKQKADELATLIRQIPSGARGKPEAKTNLRKSVMWAFTAISEDKKQRVLIVTRAFGLGLHLTDRLRGKSPIVCQSDVGRNIIEIETGSTIYTVIETPQFSHPELNGLQSDIDYIRRFHFKHMHYFLLYDPYDADIHWDVLLPFFRNWGEVMINHALLDPIRAISSVKKKRSKEKYEHTYLESFEEVLPYGSNKVAYEKRVDEIIDRMKGNRRYFVASFPFYNQNNSLQYDLIHCTSNIEGFKLYKKCAWQVFGGKSSAKNVDTENVQMELDFSNSSSGAAVVPTDESCYTKLDIAKYLQNNFCGKQDVPVDDLWDLLSLHPIFPSDCFRNEIKHHLKTYYGDKDKKGCGL